jgi:hypothetical protein
MSIRAIGERAAAPPVTQTPTHAKPSVQSAPRPDGEPSPFARVLDGLGREVNSGERMMRHAIAAGRSGQDIGPSELLALQAGVYRYSEAVDLASKLIDRASSGLKTVIGGGGQ